MKRKYEIAVLSRADFARTVRIYSPKNADRAIIMHDGQNSFYDSDATFGKSWRALDALKTLGVKNTAVIGIDSQAATREDDYLPFPNELTQYGVAQTGGKADIYLDYVLMTVMPYLEKRFGYKFYGMIGSSCGAIITLTAAARRDKRIKAYGLFSTPLLVSPAAFDGFFEQAQFDADAYYKIYTGGSEVVVPDACTDQTMAEKTPAMFMADAFRVATELKAHGANRIDLSLRGDGVHDETCWREPFCEFIDVFSKM